MSLCEGDMLPFLIRLSLYSLTAPQQHIYTLSYFRSSKPFHNRFVYKLNCSLPAHVHVLYLHQHIKGTVSPDIGLNFSV